MKTIKPRYYDAFHCLAGECPDSCCQEWDVQVDAETAARYRALPGALGDHLRQALYEDDNGETYLRNWQGRCPMWRQDGLCRIQAELGEAALCTVCRDFPRLRHDYGDFLELGLELSCPQAARMILSDSGECIETETEEPGAGEYDLEAMATLKITREKALALVSEEAANPGCGLTLLLLYGYQAQEALDGGDCADFDRQAALQAAQSLAKPGNLSELLEFFRKLEVLTPRWSALLSQPHSVQLPEQTGALARYLIQRYWLQAISDYDLIGRVKLIVIACLLVGSLGGAYVETAQLFSKEIENDADNVDAILYAVDSCPAFAADRLLGMLAQCQRAGGEPGKEAP